MRGRRSQGKEEEEEMAPKMRKFFLSLLPPGLQFGFKLKRTSVEVGLQLFRSSGGDVSGSVTPYKSRPPSHSPPPIHRMKRNNSSSIFPSDYQIVCPKRETGKKSNNSNNNNNITRFNQ